MACVLFSVVARYSMQLPGVFSPSSEALAMRDTATINIFLYSTACLHDPDLIGAWCNARSQNDELLLTTCSIGSVLKQAKDHHAPAFARAIAHYLPTKRVCTERKSSRITGHDSWSWSGFSLWLAWLLWHVQIPCHLS